VKKETKTMKKKIEKRLQPVSGPLSSIKHYTGKISPVEKNNAAEKGATSISA